MEIDRTEDLNFLRSKGYEIQREPNDMYTVYEPGAEEPSKVKGDELSKAAAKLRGDKAGSKKGKAASAAATTTTSTAKKGTDADMNPTTNAAAPKSTRKPKTPAAAAVTPAPPAAADAAHDAAVARADAAVAEHRAQKGGAKKGAAKRAGGKGGKQAADTSSAKQASTPAAAGKGGAAKGGAKKAAGGGAKKAAANGEAKPVDNSKVPEVAAVISAAGLKPLSERAGKVANPDTPKGRAILERINRCTEQTPLMASELTSFEHELARRWFAAGACERVRKDEGGLGYYKKKNGAKK